MIPRSSLFAAGAIVSALAVSRNSSAQTAPVRGVPIDESELTTYELADDPLTAQNLKDVPQLRVRPRASQQTLLRPRTSFIRPMLRTVEDIGDPYPPAFRVRLRRR